MKSNYLKLSDGRNVRILFNMNTLIEFSKKTGLELSSMDAAAIDLNILRVIAWCSAIEGESAEGKEFELSENELGRLINIQGIMEFSKIMASQLGAEKADKNQSEEKKSWFSSKKKA